MKALLPFLLVLACPLMMVVMMLFMHRGHGHDDQEETTQVRAGARSRAEQGLSLAALHDLRDDLDARLYELDERIDELEAVERRTSASASRS